MNKLLVCYLYTSFDDINSLQNFKKNYLKFDSGINHELIICFKLLKSQQIQDIVSQLNGINFKTFIDPNNKNDFDFGTYKRIAELNKNSQIFFLNSHSYPICDKWLFKLAHNSSNDSLIGTSASCESLLDSFKLKKKYKIFSYLFKKNALKKRFNSFPSPHIRTSSFLINANLFLDYLKDIKISSKEDAWEIESGKNSLTNYFKSNNLNIYVVNSEGDKFNENNWKLSETYNYFNKSKSIISDKHTRKYDALDIKEKLISRIKVWGE